MIDVHDEAKDQSQIIKGKRTKRQRQASPLQPAMAASSSSDGGSSGGFGGGGGGGRGGEIKEAKEKSAETVNYPDKIDNVTTDEEKEMANCLMLLSQGDKTHRTLNLLGLEAYRCKTCNKSFGSFQALGGHRASHKIKPKNDQENKSLGVVEEKQQDDRINRFLSLQATSGPALHNNKKPDKIHQCWICGAKFSSGQALGGHMRRHRNHVATNSMSSGMESVDGSPESKKQKHVLQLDLNLPAPEDDRYENSKFSFRSEDQILVFSTTSLVDCHY